MMLRLLEASDGVNLGEAFNKLIQDTGINAIINDPRYLVMIAISCFLIYLAIVKKFEPLLLLPIAFGMLLVNLPLGGLMASPEAAPPIMPMLAASFISKPRREAREKVINMPNCAAAPKRSSLGFCKSGPKSIMMNRRTT